MKLVICELCNEILSPRENIIACNCGSTSVRMLPNKIVSVVGGGHAIDLPVMVINNLIKIYFDKTAVKETTNGAKDAIKKADREFCTLIITHLNQKADTDHRTKFPSSHSQLILARRDEHDATLEDFYRIIDNKVAQWKGTEYEKYLRPATLFNKTKFANYLGERNARVTTNTSIHKLVNSAIEAKRNIINRGGQGD